MAFKDFSTNNFQLTAFGNAQISTSVKKYGDGSALFDGSGDYLELTDNDAFNFGTGSFTIEAWIYLNSIPNDYFITSANSFNNLFFGFRVVGGQNQIGWGGVGDSWHYSADSGITTGQWYHVALTRSGTDMRLFVNGNQVGTTQTRSTSYNLGAGNLAIGAQANSFFFNGYIDDLRITKGIARYTSNFTPPQQQLQTTADPYYSNVSLLLPMNLGPFTDSSTNNFQLTVVGNTDLSKSVVKYGTASGYFDGNEDLLEINSDNAFNFSNQDFTIEMWIKPNTNPSPQSPDVGTLISTGFPTDAKGIFLGITPSRTLYWLYSNNGSWQVPSGSQPNTVISNSTWTHIAYVRSGNNAFLFADGQLISSGTITGTLTNPNNRIYIGQRPSQGQSYAGYIDDLRITKGIARYTSNFTPPQQQLPAPSDPYQNNVSLLLHMDNNQFVDASLNNFTITPFGNARSSTQVVKYGDTAAYFDGSGDYLQTTIPDWNVGVGGEPFTIEFWAYKLDTNTGVFLTKHGGVAAWNGTNGINFNFYTTSNQLVYEYYIGGSSNTQILNSVIIPANQWIHLAVTYDGTTIRFFLDGNLQPVTGSTAYATVTDADIIQVSGEVGNSFPLNGYIDDLRITKGVARYTTTFTPPSAQLPTFTDPNFANVSLLLRTNRPFTDSSSNNFTLSAFGDAQISTSVKKFGSGSAYFDGGGDRIEIQCGSELDFPADFTVELWVYVISCDSEISLFSIASPIDSYGPMLGILPQSFGSTGTPVAEWLFGNGSWNFQLYGGQANEAIPLQTWTHLAMTRQNGVIRCFVNGILTRSVANTTAAVNFNQLISIGGRTNFGQYLNGYIDELRITKGVARYTSNFVPHTAPFVNPPSIPSGYLAFWKLADLTDSSPNGNNLINTNNVQFVQGKIGNCAQWNSPKTVTQDLRCTNSSSLNFGAGDFTVSLWVYPFTFSNDPFKNFCCLGSQMGGRCAPFIEQNGNLRFVTDFSVPSEINHPMTFNAWNHIVYTRSGGVVSVYLNNVYLNQFNYTSLTDGNFFIGLFNDQIGTTNFQYEGRIDAVGIWNRELTQSEIDILYNNGNGKEP